MGSLSLKQKDLFLVSFPFSDLSKTKVRPAIIVSNNKFNKKSEDVIVCGITAQQSLKKTHLQINTTSLSSGKLHRSCSIEPESLFKMDKRLLLKQIGVLKEKPFQDLSNKLHELLS
ncbi:type II toxin-antitoxin system PemK/MazF family toxin [Candidatus Woesearchaeota archaeon]|nr:type II toxin-antitoxin system PemK/MazF family toxin [Candidatus Woesearchaeota archaeon]